MSKVFAIASIYDTPELLPHFLDHYTRLGVNQILISSNIFLAEQESLQCNYPVRFFSTSDLRFNHPSRRQNEEKMLLEVGAATDDWVMHLDVDEFHQYAHALPDLLRLLQCNQIRAVAGTCIDRVAVDGVLRPVKAFPTLAEQYPLCGKLTEIIYHGCTQKIMIARRTVELGDGRHTARDGTKWDGPNSQITGAHHVHHFRWTGGLIERLEARFSTRRRVQPYKVQFCQEYRKKGRIDLSDPRLYVRSSRNMDYPASK